MKSKKFRITVVLMACAMILSSCSFGGKSKSSSKSDNYTTTGSAASGTYQGVIENGRYKTSKARGVTASNNDNTFNVKSFESGLTNISKKVFSTKSYIFQEGQYLSKSTVENWLGRVSKSNKTGLNPKKGKTNGTRNPVYIQSIEEQDYMKQNGNDLKLHGITVGIGLNSVDYYKKTTNGPTYSQNISDAAMKSYGQQAAQKVIKRLRQKKALKNVPIVIALYKQASDDSLVGGTFFEYSVNNGSSVGTWKKLNITNKVLPKASDATSTNSGNETDNTDFTNFKSQIQSFFPNLSGVTAQAQYENGTLSGMHITVTTQFYSETEISSFTQYISTAAQKYLPSGIPIDIKIQTSTDMQAFVYRDSGQKKFSSHVFDSY